jgi:DNA-binding LacI/PurR family transcriptional regulator
VTPRQDRAKQFLLKAIASGEFEVGNVVPAVEILAQRARCSAGTIQSALNVLAQEGIVKRVRRLGTLVARQPTTKRVCLMMSLDNHTNLLLYQAVHELFVQAGFAVDFLMASTDIEMTLARCREITSGALHPDTIVVLSPEQMGAGFFKVTAHFGSSIIYSLGATNYPESHTVTPDQHHAARLVVEHLLALGHRKIGVVAGGKPGEQTWAAESANACKHLLEISGAEFFPHYFWKENTDAMLRRMKDAGVTAYWALHDHHAVSVIQGCRQLGIRVPEDLSVVGRHDTPWSTESIPQLTSISLDPQATAQAILRALQADDPESIKGTRTLVPPRLAVRASTATVRL